VIPGLDPGPLDVFFGPIARPKKFQHRYTIHIVLLVLTLLTTSFTAGFAFFFGAIGVGDPRPFLLFTWSTFLHGLWYSVPLLVILGAHEFGHYFACRYHDVDATLPYFLPAPLPLTGTLGAVIRIKEAFPSKRALFDIGVAGPIAGFLALLPVLFWGVTLSSVVPVSETREALHFGEPLLFKFVAWLHFSSVRDGYEVLLHPMGFAAWWGMLATALNLMPFGQLDGGHVVYSLLGRRAAYVSVATLLAAILLTMSSLSWLSMAVMMLVMAFFLGVRHPRIVDEDTPLDGTRKLIAAFAFLIFILCFTPVPIQTFFGK
jgi:membrane-associated protease RseP (regulator of RpoE activity)